MTVALAGCTVEVAKLRQPRAVAADGPTDYPQPTPDNASVGPDSTDGVGGAVDASDDASVPDVPLMPDGLGGGGTGGLDMMSGTGGVVATGGAGGSVVDVATGADAPEDAAMDNASGVGGVSATGGIAGTGGAVGTGGSTAMDGGIGTGGTTGSGGMTGTGGVLASGGAQGTGGRPDAGSSGTVVTFSNGRAQGAMVGLGHLSLGLLDSVSSPTCGGAAISGLPPSDPALSFTSSCAPADITWSSVNGLCATGSIPALPRNPTQSDYDRNWGVLIGANVDDAGQTLGVSYRSMTLTTTGRPSSGLRANVHVRGDPDNITYCATMTYGTTVQFMYFNTECWENTGRYLSSANVANIDLIGVHVPSSDMAIAVSNLCLTRIEFSR